MNGEFISRTTACFTGHRVIRQSVIPQVRARLAYEIALAYDEGYRTFICGGARGFDTLAAQEVLRLRESRKDIRIVLVIPCADQASRWPPADRETWQRIRELSDEVHILSDHYYAGCMQVRNRYMADRSSLCLCWLTRFEGGTWSTVRYALYCGLTVKNLAMPEQPVPVMKENPWNYISISRSACENANTARLSLSLPGRKRKASISVISSGKRK